MVGLYLVSAMVLCHLCSSKIIWNDEYKSNQDNGPNIVLVIADDLGWGDVGFNRKPDGFDYHDLGIPETPYLDKTAKESLILDNFYTQASCTPTRGSLMTGKYAYRLGQMFSSSVMTSSDKKGPSDMFLSEVRFGLILNENYIDWLISTQYLHSGKCIP